MNTEVAIQTVRQCLRSVKPGIDLHCVSNNTPLLETRIITSLDVLDLIVHLEQASGQPITRTQLVAGSFRDVNTIAKVFLSSESQS